MSFSPREPRRPHALKVTVTDDTLTVDLVDGRTLSVPVGWYPRLAHATPAERENWRVIGRGEGIQRDARWDRVLRRLGYRASAGETGLVGRELEVPVARIRTARAEPPRA